MTNLPDGALFVAEPAILALEDGSIFQGIAIGAAGQTVGEVVFNTAMTGYQEILTDPSYARQIVTLTYPHIGNVGANNQDQESSHIWAAGLVIRDLSLAVSNWRSQETLHDYLARHQIVGIAEVDTRRLTRILRDKGALRGCIMTGKSIDAAKRDIQKFGGMQGLDLAKEVTVQQAYPWTQGVWQPSNRYNNIEQQAAIWHVVAYDFGVKHTILRLLAERGCRITVVPATTSAEEALALKPHGIFLSNGPGDPAACDYAIAAAQQFLQQQIPLFGICLGHQLLGLACGAQTIKMKFGHHGANHPVLELETGRVLITSQNHGFAVDESSLPSDLRPTHRSLFDGSLQGIAHTKKPAFSFQGHPEASPGPHDVGSLFDHFIELMKTHAKTN